jgi:hypothetical protein
MVVLLREAFGGIVTGQHVILDFDALVNDFTGEVLPNIFDHLSATDTLSFDGRASGDLSGTEIIATLNGTIEYWTGNTSLPPAWACTAANHVITIKR